MLHLTGKRTQRGWKQAEQKLGHTRVVQRDKTGAEDGDHHAKEKMRRTGSKRGTALQQGRGQGSGQLGSGCGKALPPQGDGLGKVGRKVGQKTAEPFEEISNGRQKNRPIKLWRACGQGGKPAPQQQERQPEQQTQKQVEQGHHKGSSAAPTQM